MHKQPKGVYVSGLPDVESVDSSYGVHQQASARPVSRSVADLKKANTVAHIKNSQLSNADSNRNPKNGGLGQQ